MATGQPKARNRKLPAGSSGALLSLSATKRINTRSTLQLWGMEAAGPLVHISVTIPCSVFLASLLIVLICFPTEHSWPPISIFFSILLSIPLGPLWEEISWRAFTLRELESRFSRIVAALIVGLYWAIWHIPLWLTTLNLTRDLVIPVLLIASANLVGWSVTFAFLYNQSGRSLPVVIVMHGMYAAIQNLVFATAPYRNLHLIVISAILSVCRGLCLAKRTKCVSNSNFSSGGGLAQLPPRMSHQESGRPLGGLRNIGPV